MRERARKRKHRVRQRETYQWRQGDVFKAGDKGQDRERDRERERELVIGESE